MARRRRPSRPLSCAPAAAVLAAAGCVAGGVYVGVTRTPGGQPPPATVAAPADLPAPARPQPPEPPAPQVRRLPVAGAAGYYVVIRPDGTSELHTPEGVQPLVDATTAALPSEDELARRLAEAEARRAARPQVKKALGQVVVLDQGVVDLPADAALVFAGPDKAVALLPDGTSAVYHADGRVEPRAARQPKGKP